MPQGVKLLNRNKKPSNKKHFKLNGAKYTKKGNPKNTKVKNANEIGRAMEQQRISKNINRSIETLAASKAIRAGDTVNMSDVKAKAKEYNRDVARLNLTRKKTRIEEKLEELKKNVLAKTGEEMDVTI